MVTALYTLAHLGLGACSSSQQESQDVEAQDGEQQADGQDQEQQEGQQNQNEAAQGNAANGGGDLANNEGGASAEGDPAAVDGATTDATAEGGDATTGDATAQATGEGGGNGDLQGIISEMNGQPAADGSQAAAPAGADVASANAGAAPVGNAAAAPAPGAAPGAQAAAAPAGPSAGPGLPETGSKMPYIVQSGDTLAKISTRIYGNNKRWKEISSLSGLSNPSKIYPGDVVYYTLDQESTTFATAYEGVQRAVTQVQNGETLAKIAKRVYGKAGAWKSIWRQNDTIVNPDKLNAGMTVYYIQAGALSAAIKEIKSKIEGIAKNTKQQSDNISDWTISALSSSAIDCGQVLTSTTLSGGYVAADLILSVLG